MSTDRKMHKQANQAYGRPGTFDMAKITNSQSEKNEKKMSTDFLNTHSVHKLGK